MQSLKPLLAGILFSFCFNAAFSQSNFIKGYVVLSNSDTISGFLKQEPEGDLLTRVIFSNNMDGSSSKEYTLNDAKAFQYNEGNIFEAVNYTDLSNAQTINFTRLVLRGYYSLYSLKQKDVQYFILKHSDSTWLLHDVIFLTATTVDTRENYKNILAFISRGCSGFNDNMDALSYSEKSLTNMLKKINECVAPNTVNSVVAVKPKSNTSFFVFAGGLPLGDSYEYAGRIGARISTPSISKHTSLNVALSYESYKTTETKVYSYTLSKTYDHTLQVASLGSTVQYSFTSGKIQPYIEAGFGVVYSKENDSLHIYPSDNPETKFNFDLIGAVGIEAYLSKHFAIKADWRYEVIMHYPVVGVAYFF